MAYVRGSITEFALSHDGETENPPFSNRTKYNGWYYQEKDPYHKTWKEGEKYTSYKDDKLGLVFDFGNGVKYISKNYPYCATGVSYWYFFGGFPLPTINTAEGFAYVPTLYNLAKKNGWLTAEPLEDDIVLHDFKGDGFYDHTGIFIKWEVKGVSFWCMEANTSPNEKGSQDNGGGDFQRLRYVNGHGMKCVFVNVIDNAK
jgi:hypothetical protein